MSALTQYEKIYLLHEYGICLDTKSFELTGEVDEAMYLRALKNLHYLNQTNCEITIFLSSMGGSTSHAIAIYDLIKNSSNRVRIVATGEVYSAGTMILMSGDERIMTDNARLMLHTGEESLGPDKPRNIDALYKMNRADEELMYRMYMERINEKKKADKKKYLTTKEVQDMLVNDIYLDAKTSLSLGLITSIGYVV